LSMALCSDTGIYCCPAWPEVPVDLLRALRAGLGRG
jgi:hypothetical protein